MLDPAVGLLGDPVRSQVACYHKSQRGAQRRARQVVEGTQYRTEQGATGQRQHRSRQKQYGRDRVDQHEQQRCNGAGALDPGFECRAVELVTVDNGERERGRQRQEKDNAHEVVVSHRRCSIDGG